MFTLTFWCHVDFQEKKDQLQRVPPQSSGHTVEKKVTLLFPMSFWCHECFQGDKQARHESRRARGQGGPKKGAAQEDEQAVCDFTNFNMIKLLSPRSGITRWLTSNASRTSEELLCYFCKKDCCTTQTWPCVGCGQTTPRGTRAHPSCVNQFADIQVCEVCLNDSE